MAFSPTRRGVWMGLAAAFAACAVLAPALRLQAHKAITSKYTYNDDVFPIVRDRCGRCHLPGGAAPMSLLSYKDAVPWAESIRQEVMAERMPPWFADPLGPAVTGGHTLSAREADVLLTWASGGTPEGAREKTPSVPPIATGWRAGAPDLALPVPAPHTVPESLEEETVEYAVPTGLTAARRVAAADLLPGTPALVRSATIAVVGGPVLAAWQPDTDPTPTPPGAAFLLEAGSTLQVRVRYKKPWQEAQKAWTDRSTIGLYFAPSATPPLVIQSATFAASPAAPDASDRRTFGGPIPSGRVIAVRLTVDRPYASVVVNAVRPDGTTASLLALRHPRPEWSRRYWLTVPVEIPPGTSLAATAVAVSGSAVDGRPVVAGVEPLAVDASLVRP